MVKKEGTEFACPKCGNFLERQHWGINETLTAYQDMLTCKDVKCDYHRLVKCTHKDLYQEKKGS